MKRVLFLTLLLTGAVFINGCEKPAASGATTAAPANPLIPTKAQPKLATIDLWIGKEQMVTEMARTEEQERTGMMFRTNMAENEGMIFVLPAPERASFWMMNTILPLSAAYIDPDGQILEIHDFQPHDTNSVIAASDNIQFVLETPQGWFKRHNIKEGTVIATERGTLRKTFLGDK
jgi:uncharacterized membrane protein (UPF0127 family)